MATRKKRAKPRSSVPETVQGNAVYLLALETMQRLASERDRHEGNARGLELSLEMSRKALARAESQLTAARAAAEVAELERLQFEQERDRYAAKCGATLGGE